MSLQIVELGTCTTIPANNRIENDNLTTQSLHYIVSTGHSKHFHNENTSISTIHYSGGSRNSRKRGAPTPEGGPPIYHLARFLLKTA